VDDWRAIPGYSNYEASGVSGQIRNAQTGRVLRPSKHRRGYHFLSLRDDTKRKKAVYVHKLITLTFLGPNTKGTVNHKNFDPSDNRIDNLEYMTARENLMHAHQHGRIPLPPGYKVGHQESQGVRHARAILNDEIVREIRISTESNKVLALRYGVCSKHIGDVRARRAWGHVA
jgi:hypothetical protein